MASGGKFTRIVACSQAGYALALALPSLQSAWSDVVASALVGAVGFSAARAVAVLSTASRSDAGAERRACVAVASYATAASAAALGTAANAGALLGAAPLLNGAPSLAGAGAKLAVRAARAASVATLLHTGAAALAIHALRQSPAGDAMLRRFGLHAPPVWDTAAGGARNRHAFSGAGRTLAGSAPLASELDL